MYSCPAALQVIGVMNYKRNSLGKIPLCWGDQNREKDFFSLQIGVMYCLFENKRYLCIRFRKALPKEVSRKRQAKG